MHFKSDKDAAWEKLEASITMRRWDATRTAWIDFGIPRIDPPGSVPEVTLSAFLEDLSPFSGVESTEMVDTVVKISRGEIPDIIFREAVYWFHKSIHVLGSSEMNVNLGLPTWALSAAYQSAFFAARSTMAFFGLAVAEAQGFSIVVDLGRNMHGLTPRKARELGAFEEQASLRSNGALFGHAHVWRLFQRLLRVATRAPWPPGWTAFFQDVKVADLVRQRHNLHYQLGFWVMDDMHQVIESDAFRDVSPTGKGRDLFHVDRDNFTLAVAFTLSRMALSLFQSFAPATNRLLSEQAIVAAVCGADRHPLFADSLRSPLTAA